MPEINVYGIEPSFESVIQTSDLDYLRQENVQSDDSTEHDRTVMAGEIETLLGLKHVASEEISSDEWKEMTQASIHGDLDAKNQVLRRCLADIYSQVKDFTDSLNSTELLLEDNFQVALIAGHSAIAAYDPAKRYSLQYTIHNQVSKAIFKNARDGGLVHLPASYYEAGESETLESQGAKSPKQNITRTAREITYDHFVRLDDVKQAAPEEFDPFIVTAKKMDDELLYSVLQKLPATRRRILNFRYGLQGTTPHTQWEIAEEGAPKKVSIQSVRRKEQFALRTIQHSEYAKELRQHYVFIDEIPGLHKKRTEEYWAKKYAEAVPKH